jgi:ribonuclease HI
MGSSMNLLFVDGGVINTNPSKIGGTWAWRVVEGDIRGADPEYTVVQKEGSGVVTPHQAGMDTISNNYAEMIALIRGLQALPEDWVGTVCSDSKITLGRAFSGWAWNGIPTALRYEFLDAVKRLRNWKKIKPKHLDGHPTNMQLSKGIGKRGNPVSEHNRWCDHACAEAGNLFVLMGGRG